MSGLLSMPLQDCPYGHGSMIAIDGLWALTGVNPPQAQPRNPLETLFATAAPRFTPNNRALVLQAWRCPTCGAVQLFDRGAPNAGS